MARTPRHRADGRRVEDVYDALSGPVLGYFRSHRMADPEGLTGDVFVAVAERFSSFEGDEAALRRWVFTIAHHRRVDAIRRERVRSLHKVDGPPPEGTGPEDWSDPFDPDLVAALDALTDDQRDVVVLRFVADLPVAEVAQLTGHSPGAVKMLQHRALTALSVRLERRS